METITDDTSVLMAAALMALADRTPERRLSISKVELDVAIGEYTMTFDTDGTLVIETGASSDTEAH